MTRFEKNRKWLDNRSQSHPHVTTRRVGLPDPADVAQSHPVWDFVCAPTSADTAEWRFALAADLEAFERTYTGDLT